ncbi:MAG TPA: hypothetical protein PLO73_14855, partial [Spirochaetota bacterium]|nr:hypothetical protein [Spirochaetota bacterium]
CRTMVAEFIEARTQHITPYFLYGYHCPLLLRLDLAYAFGCAFSSASYSLYPCGGFRFISLLIVE